MTITNNTIVVTNSEKYKTQYKYAKGDYLCKYCFVIINNSNAYKHRKSKKHKRNLEDLGLSNLFKEIEIKQNKVKTKVKLK